MPGAGHSRFADRNPAGLHGLRHFSNQLNLEQTIDELCSLNADVVGQIELPLEGTGRDAPIEILALSFIELPTFNGERVLLSRDSDFIRGKPASASDIRYRSSARRSTLQRGYLSSLPPCWAASTKSKKRSKPTIDRHKGAMS